MSDQRKTSAGWLKNLFGSKPALPAVPANKLSPEMEINFWKAKAAQVESEKAELQLRFDGLKKHADEISNRILDLERDQSEAVLGQFDLKLQKLTTKDKIVCITTKHKSLLDHKMFARINHVLRTRCPWLDLVFMIHEDVDLKTLDDEQLGAIGLKREKKKGEEDESGGVLC